MADAVGFTFPDGGQNTRFHASTIGRWVIMDANQQHQKKKKIEQSNNFPKPVLKFFWICFFLSFYFHVTVL